MHAAGFEPIITGIEQPQTHDLICDATVISLLKLCTVLNCRYNVGERAAGQGVYHGLYHGAL
jgi:hypothetical protein